jgi:acetylornithine deacetylase/succinyl-diaminopimelate desuccinylase-like protein
MPDENVNVNLRIDLHVHPHESSDRVAEKLAEILHAVVGLTTITKERLMAVSAQVQAFSDRVNAATNEIASDLKTLRDKIAAGSTLSAEDQALLDSAASRLEAMGVDPEDPVPAVS